MLWCSSTPGALIQWAVEVEGGGGQLREQDGQLQQVVPPQQLDSHGTPTPLQRSSNHIVGKLATGPQFDQVRLTGAAQHQLVLHPQPVAARVGVLVQPGAHFNAAQEQMPSWKQGSQSVVPRNSAGRGGAGSRPTAWVSPCP